MPMNKYMKFILTVIACGLLALVVQRVGWVRPAAP